MGAKKAVDLDDLINISLAMDELYGALKDAVEDATPRVKHDVIEVIEFTYKDVSDRLNQYI